MSLSGEHPWEDTSASGWWMIPTLRMHQRFLIGSSYRVYLQSPPGAALPEARIPHGTLLGLEELGACRAESEIDGQSATPEGPNIAEMEEFNE